MIQTDSSIRKDGGYILNEEKVETGEVTADTTTELRGLWRSPPRQTP